MKIDVLEIEDKDDGTATIKFDMDEETTNLFIREGIKLLISEVSEKHCVVTIDEWDDWVKAGNDVTPGRTWELTSQEAQAFFQIGTLNAIRAGIDAVEDKIQYELDFEKDINDADTTN